MKWVHLIRTLCPYIYFVYSKGGHTWINPSKRLVDLALDRWNMCRLRADNTSIVTVMLDPPGPPRAQVLRRLHGLQSPLNQLQNHPPFQPTAIPNPHSTTETVQTGCSSSTPAFQEQTVSKGDENAPPNRTHQGIAKDDTSKGDKEGTGVKPPTSGISGDAALNKQKQQICSEDKEEGTIAIISRYFFPSQVL